MRVLLTTWAGRSHFFPMVPLAWALRLAGHEVRVATQPGFAGVVTQAGLPVTVVGRDVDVAKVMRENIGRHMDRAVVPPDRWSAESDPDGRAAQLRRARLGLGHFVAIAEAMADDTVAFARSWRPDLVIFEPTTFAGPIAARVLGVPAARQLWTVDFTAQVGEIEMDLLGHLADRFGLDRLEVSGDWTVDPCPPRLQAPGPHAGDRVLAIRYVPYNGPAVMPRWLLDPPPRPRVCLTWGMSMGELGIRTRIGFAEILRAVAELDVEVVAAVAPGQAAGLGEVPGNVRVAESLALHLLMPTCDAIVHQGGGGTLMTSMTYGIPQLMLPHVPDQVANARRLVATGAGVSVLADEAEPGDVRDRLATLLADDRARAAATSLSTENAARPSPVEVAAALEEAARPRTGAHR